MPARKTTTRVATHDFSTSLNGHRVYVHRGDAYPSDHPLVKKFKASFTSPEEWTEAQLNHVDPWRVARGNVEQATANPGEKRNVTTQED